MIKNLMAKFVKEQEGGIAEYVIVLGLVALIAIVLGPKLKGFFTPGQRHHQGAPGSQPRPARGPRRALCRRRRAGVRRGGRDQGRRGLRSHRPTRPQLRSHP